MIIGIDTSCYTTSIALIDSNGAIIDDRRVMLEVKPGQRGLRQSEAVFQHIQNFPRLVDDYKQTALITGVAASTRPRPVFGSYLPVFKVGAGLGETLARLLGVPFYPTSHQEGHLRAGFINNELPRETFLAWHLSGGTTELLVAKPVAGGFDIEKVGGSSDLQVGQFVDRIGVALGSRFPAGVYLEELAKQSQSEAALPVVTKELTISFSGPDSAGKRLLDSGIDPSELARRVFNCISRSLVKVTLEAIRRYDINLVIFTGGVAANGLIRAALLHEASLHSIKMIFAPQKLSSDNAVGVGLIGFDLVRGMSGEA